MCVCVFLQQLIFAKTTERAENCKMKEKKICNCCCHSIVVAVDVYWQITGRKYKKLVSKIEKPAKIRFEIRETSWKHVEKRDTAAATKSIYKLKIAARVLSKAKLSSLGIVFVNGAGRGWLA